MTNLQCPGDGPYYFDYAAATPLDPRVLAAMQPYLTEEFYNPSAAYGPARRLATALAHHRGLVAKPLGARASEIIFTSGGTESDNLAISGVLAAHPGAKLVVSAIEHEAVLAPAQRWGAQLCPVGPDGLINPDELVKLVGDDTVLVSIIYANNEIGVIQPLAEIAARLAQIRQQRQQRGVDLPLYLHSDACQAAGLLNLQVSRLGVDLMTINAGKIYGPKGSGALYVKSGVRLAAQVQGGGQERGLRSGTENLAASAGLAEALSLAQAARRSETKRLQALQQQMVKGLAAKIPAARINGSLKKRLANNLSVRLPGQDNERLLVKLEQTGILAAAGSACSALSGGAPSHVLKAIGLSDDDARATLRFSFGQATTPPQIDYLVDVLSKIIA